MPKEIEITYQSKDTFEYIIVTNKIQPSFNAGYVFPKSNIVNTFDDEKYAIERAELYATEKNRKVAVYKIRYSCPISQITHLELLKIFEP